MMDSSLDGVESASFSRGQRVSGTLANVGSPWA